MNDEFYCLTYLIVVRGWGFDEEPHNDFRWEHCSNLTYQLANEENQ